MRHDNHTTTGDPIVRKQLRQSGILDAGAVGNRLIFSMEGIDRITWSIRQLDTGGGAFTFELKITHDGVVWTSLSTPSTLSANGTTNASIDVFAVKMGCIEVTSAKGSTTNFAVTVYGEGVESNIMPGASISTGGYEMGV